MQSLGILRDIRVEELELMLSWRNEPTIRNNMYTRHEILLEEHLNWWASVNKRDDQQYLMYECNNAPLGIVGIADIDFQNRNASWAFYASPLAAKGTGSKMEYLALQHAFENLKLHKLYCEVLAFNTPVIKLHKKFGFTEEGIFRDQHRVDQEYVDVYRLGILNREWSVKRPEIITKLKKLYK